MLARMKGYDIGKHLRIETFGYADDVTLISLGGADQDIEESDKCLDRLTHRRRHEHQHNIYNIYMHMTQKTKLSLQCHCPRLQRWNARRQTMLTSAVFVVCGSKRSQGWSGTWLYAIDNTSWLIKSSSWLHDITAVFRPPECRWFRVQAWFN